jgi:hypothetical protein
VDANTKVFDAGLEGLDGAAVVLSFGASYRTQRAWRFDFGLSEDLKIDASPDVVFHVRGPSRILTVIVRVATRQRRPASRAADYCHCGGHGLASTRGLRTSTTLRNEQSALLRLQRPRRRGLKIAAWIAAGPRGAGGRADDRRIAAHRSRRAQGGIAGRVFAMQRAATSRCKARFRAESVSMACVPGERTLRSRTATAFGDAPFASLDQARLSVRLWPLITSRRVEFGGPVTVDKLQLRLAVAPNGQDKLVGRTRAPATPATGPDPSSGEPETGKTPFELSIAKLLLRASEVSFEDAQANTRYVVSGLTLETGALRKGEPIELHSALAITRNAAPLGRFEMRTRLDVEPAGTDHSRQDPGPRDAAPGRWQGTCRIHLEAPRLALQPSRSRHRGAGSAGPRR